MKLLFTICLIGFTLSLSAQDHPELSFKLMSEEDMQQKSPEELRLLRNELFARHGYIFKSADLKEYFGAKAWYKPQFSNVDDKLSHLEKRNIRLIAQMEITAKKHHKVRKARPE